MQKRLRRFLLINWIPLSAGFYLTAKGVEYAYRIRGGAAVGSEWLITPLLLFAWKMTSGIRREAKRFLKYRIRKAIRARQRRIRYEARRKMEVA